MTARVGFGEVSDTLKRGGGCAERVKRSDKRESKNPVRLGTANKSKGNTATTSGCKFLKHDGNGVPMQCG